MPSPVGHAIAGLTTAWIAERVLRKVRLQPDPTRGFETARWLPLACVVAAVAPDLDLLISSHRTYSHSIGAAMVVGLGTCLMWTIRSKFRVKGQRSHPAATVVALTIATAYFTHIVLDWLGKDSSVPPGMMALWPISANFYLSGLDLFPEISRRYWRPSEFIVGNLQSIAWEIAILGPVAAVAFWIRFKTNFQRRVRGETS